MEVRLWAVWHHGRVLTREDLAATDDALRDGLTRLIVSYATSPVRRIAVVGNAPLEANQERARRIDEADLVFRCNSFALDGPLDAPCLGRRADVVVLNRGTRITPSVFQRYPSRLYLRSNAGAIYRRKPTVPLPGIDVWPDDLGCVSIPNRAVVAELRQLLAFCNERRDGSAVLIPTTGTVAAWLAYRLFADAELLLVGFSILFAVEQPTEWRHHWDLGAGRVPVSSAHQVTAEGMLLRRWVSERRAEALA